MIYGCPNLSCSHYTKRDFVRKDGFYFRKNDSRKIKRFRCGHCGKKFSSATFSLAFRQKKRRVNEPLFKLLASGVSMRRAAKILNIHRITVKRKLIYLAAKARLAQQELLGKLAKDKVTFMQFDDLITIEHTKLKPLAVTTAVDANRRFILGTEVSSIPAFGHLAAMSRKKYGARENAHPEGIKRLFEQIKDAIDDEALIKSDEHSFYPKVVKKFFPKCRHKRYKGARGSIAGQGELKKLKYDPLFVLNHTHAMLRANINRLFRKTWCTTKNPDMLKNHLDLYIHYFNQNLA